MAPLKIHLGHHFFGSGNLGDDLMLAGLLRAVERTGRAVEWTCCTGEPAASQARRFPEVTWLPCQPAVQEAAVSEADVWLGAGDTPFQTAVGPWFLEHLVSEVARCRRWGVPMYFLGVGVESAAAASRPETAQILAAAEGVWARDTGSAELLAALGTRARIVPSADLANACLCEHAFGPPDPEEAGFVLAVDDPAKLPDASLNALLEGSPARRVAWLVQEARALPGTERSLHARLAPLLQVWAEMRAPEYEQAASVSALLASWGEPGWLCSSRYHAMLIGAWAGARVAAIARSEKVRLGAEQLGLPVTTAWPEDADAARAFLATAREVPRAVLADLAQTCLRHVTDFLEQAHAARKTPGRADWRGALADEFVRHQREQSRAQRELGQATARHARLEREHDRILQATGATERDLTARLSAAEADRAARLEVIEKQAARYSALEAEHDSVLRTTAAAAADWEQRLAAAEADRAARLQVIEEQAARHSALEGEHDRVLRESEAARLDWENRFAAAEADRAARLRVIEEQGARHSALEAEHDRLLRESAERAAQLTAQLEASESDRAARLRVIEEQGARHSALEAEHDRVLRESAAQRGALEAALAEARQRTQETEARLAALRATRLVRWGKQLGLIQPDSK